MPNIVQKTFSSIVKAKDFAVKHPKFCFFGIPAMLLATYVAAPIVVAMIKSVIIAIVVGVVMSSLPFIAMAVLLQVYTPLKPMTWLKDGLVNLLGKLKNAVVNKCFKSSDSCKIEKKAKKVKSEPVPVVKTSILDADDPYSVALHTFVDLKKGAYAEEEAVIAKKQQPGQIQKAYGWVRSLMVKPKATGVETARRPATARCA